MADRDALWESAMDYFAMTQAEAGEGVYGLSVCSLPDSTAEQIAEAAGTGRLPQTTMRTSTVGTLRAFGYDVVPTGQSPHATLTLPNPPSDTDWEHLQQAFDSPRHNPVARKTIG